MNKSFAEEYWELDDKIQHKEGRLKLIRDINQINKVQRDIEKLKQKKRKLVEKRDS